VDSEEKGRAIAGKAKRGPVDNNNGVTGSIGFSMLIIRFGLAAVFCTRPGVLLESATMR
jgi:hypothetical protein